MDATINKGPSHGETCFVNLHYTSEVYLPSFLVCAYIYFKARVACAELHVLSHYEVVSLMITCTEAGTSGGTDCRVFKSWIIWMDFRVTA